MAEDRSAEWKLTPTFRGIPHRNFILHLFRLSIASSQTTLKTQWPELNHPPINIYVSGTQVGLRWVILLFHMASVGMVSSWWLDRFVGPKIVVGPTPTPGTWQMGKTLSSPSRPPLPCSVLFLRLFHHEKWTSYMVTQGPRMRVSRVPGMNELYGSLCFELWKSRMS